MPRTPPAWKNQKLRLFHGTVDTFAAAILAAVNPALGRRGTDFGPGFYTTTLRRQAEAWAAQMAARHSTATSRVQPAVIRFDVPRDDLAALESVWFVRAAFDADDYWSLVWHCRRLGPAHARVQPPGSYDLATGPMAAIWRQRAAFFDSDQVSFHTAKAAAVLNSLPASAKRRVL